MEFVSVRCDEARNILMGGTMGHEAHHDTDRVKGFGSRWTV